MVVRIHRQGYPSDRQIIPEHKVIFRHVYRVIDRVCCCLIIPVTSQISLDTSMRIEADPPDSR